MAVQIAGNNGTIIGAGEEARKAGHVMVMPKGGNHYRYSGYTGTIGAALAANSEVFQFRFLSGVKSYALIHMIRFDGMGIVAVSTAAGPIGFEALIARSWTAAGSGGTRIAVTGDNLNIETVNPNSQVNDLGIATTGALTAGTKTLDANAIGGVLGGVGTGAVTIYGPTGLIAPTYLFEDGETGNCPIVLGNQEGFVIRTTHAGPTALTYAARFSVSWTEVTAF
jgi:hypothetical protein